jgi:hypothetical protein
MQHMHGLEQQANSLEQTGKEEWLTVASFDHGVIKHRILPSVLLAASAARDVTVHEWLFKLSLSTSMLQRRQW